MASKTTAEEAQLENKVEELSDATTDEERADPLEAAKKLNAGTKELAIQIKQEREEIEEAKHAVAAERALLEVGGRADAGRKVKTQEQLDQEEADSIINRFD